MHGRKQGANFQIAEEMRSSGDFGDRLALAPDGSRFRPVWNSTGSATKQGQLDLFETPVMAEVENNRSISGCRTARRSASTNWKVLSPQ